MPNCRWYESESETRAAVTGYLRLNESQEKRENSNDPHHGDTGITSVVTCRLTGGKISSPSQPKSITVSISTGIDKRYLYRLKCKRYPSLLVCFFARNNCFLSVRVWLYFVSTGHCRIIGRLLSFQHFLMYGIVILWRHCVHWSKPYTFFTSKAIVCRF